MMKTLPLAVYTADHGLAWTYPKDEIGFAEIDACRKVFGPLPDFDAGAKGFCGIWATGDRVFAMRCQSVAAWDFRGRNATYLAVTWLPRNEAATTDFERLLGSDALCAPTKKPPAFFELDTECPAISASAPEPVLRDGFQRIGGIIAGTPASRQVLAKRTGEAMAVACTILDSVEAKSAKETNLASIPHDSAHDANRIRNENPVAGMPTAASSVSSILILVAVSGWLLAVVLLLKVWSLSLENARLGEMPEKRHGKEVFMQRLR